jgi:hypothetical protein
MFQVIAPWLGYLATLMLALSLMVNSDIRFRWFNLFGCLSFILYGSIIGAIPVILTNVLLLAINLYYLIRIYRTKEDFDLFPFQWTDPLPQKFIRFHEKDLHTYFPRFEPNELNPAIRFMVLRDMAIANLFSANLLPDGSAEVDLNFTVSKYRDYKVGRYIFNQEKKYLLKQGAKRIVYTQVDHPPHEAYLKRMGFTTQPYHGQQALILEL